MVKMLRRIRSTVNAVNLISAFLGAGMTVIGLFFPYIGLDISKQVATVFVLVGLGLIVFALFLAGWLFLKNIRKNRIESTKNNTGKQLQIELQDCVASSSFMPTRIWSKSNLFGKSVVEATAKFCPVGAIKLNYLGLHIGAYMSEASHLPIGMLDRDATYTISFECPNSVLDRASNTQVGCYLEAKSGDKSWRSNDCSLSLGIARQYAP